MTFEKLDIGQKFIFVRDIEKAWAILYIKTSNTSATNIQDGSKLTLFSSSEKGLTIDEVVVRVVL